MKRPSGSVYLGGGNEPNVLIPISLVEEKLMEEEEELCSEGQGEKKRRLRVDQVRALEKNFEVENKLDPERKARLARDLGLLPRQVAVWFQNRRARWKTKHLERDFAALRASYDALSLDCASLRRDKEALLDQISELRTRMAAVEARDFSIKEETLMSESDHKVSEAAPMAVIYKHGSSDSDSSAVLNDEKCPYQGGIFELENSDWKDQRTLFYEQQLMKMEEQSFSELFSEEQATTPLSWYCSENWNPMEG